MPRVTVLSKPQYTLAKIFIIPTCYYVAIAIAALIFIFPESLNHVWLYVCLLKAGRCPFVLTIMVGPRYKAASSKYIFPSLHWDHIHCD